MKKVLLIGSQHGDEKLGALLIQYITEHYHELLPSITYILANPQAYERNIRYLETDMNRSYVDTPTTYEEHRASQLLDRLNDESADIALDLHTTRCVQPPSYIVYQPNSEARRYMELSSIGIVVHMSQDMTKRSLIGKNNSVISVEVQDDTISSELLESLVCDILNYLTDTPAKVQKTHYEVTGHILKSEITEEDASSLNNFQLFKDDYYPILTGNNSYKRNTHYLGFKARKLGATVRQAVNNGINKV